MDTLIIMFEYALTKGQYEKLQEKYTSTDDEELIAEITPVITPEADEIDSSFMAKGSCKDLPPRYMFGRERSEIAAAKKICKGCVVVETCLEYALFKRYDNGVWGGKSERERLKMLKIRRTEKLAKE